VIVEMSKLASQVVVFQRTPAWVIAKNNLDIKG
jgi:cation diffusion facilitator CzcD-associated flavoprotein CzcO